ncbi:MAG: hypothetical protein JRN59_06310 [Nitrososphaerota archaeon]|nr:hypothetical protein [Nitrososphaerota archaeon]
MKYMTDAHIANVSELLRRNGVDCKTVHERMLNNSDSRISIPDPKIVEFLQEERAEGNDITLICNDEDLQVIAGYNTYQSSLYPR